MDPRSFIMLMNDLGWEKRVHYFMVEQKLGETIMTGPGVEHHVCFFRGKCTAFAKVGFLTADKVVIYYCYYILV